jgi:hypothetical protein
LLFKAAIALARRMTVLSQERHLMAIDTSMAPDLRTICEIADPNMAWQHNSDRVLGTSIRTAQGKVRKGPRHGVISFINHEAALLRHQFRTLRRRAVKQAKMFKGLAIVLQRAPDSGCLGAIPRPDHPGRKRQVCDQ